MLLKRFSEITVRNAANGKTAGQHGLNLKDMIDIIRQAGDDLFAQCVNDRHEHQPYKCNVLERMARSFHDFDQTRATHFTVRRSSVASEGFGSGRHS